MKTSEIKNLNVLEIKEEIARSKKNLLNLRIQMANHRLKNNNEIKHAKRKIAKLMTVLGENTRSQQKG